MGSTLNTLVPFPNGTKDLNFDASFPVGTLVAPHGTVTDALVFEVSCAVNATAANAALTPTQRQAVLASFSVSFRQHLASPGESGGILDPYQGVPLDEVRLDALRLLEQEVEGLDDTVTGLAKPFVAGANTLTFRVFLPLGHLAKVAESELFSGLSHEQLLDCELKLKKAGDAFKTAVPALSLTACQVRFIPGTKKAEARRIGLVPHVRPVFNAQSDTITTPPGLVMELSHRGALATTPLTALMVTVNGDVVTDDPSTPREVYADYLRKYPSISTEERTITSSRTPVYVVAPGAMTRMFTGAVSAKQKTKTTEWDGRALFLPLLSHQEVMALIKRYAARLENGQAVLAVNTALYEGLDVEDRLIPFCGFTLFRHDEEGHHDYSGIYCAKGGNPYVVIPEQRQRQAALKVADAMRASDRFPGGNQALVRSIVRDECRWIPGSITHTDGFRVPTPVQEDVKRIIRDAATSLNASLAVAL